MAKTVDCRLDGGYGYILVYRLTHTKGDSYVTYTVNILVDATVHGLIKTVKQYQQDTGERYDKSFVEFDGEIVKLSKVEMLIMYFKEVAGECSWV